mmetsp:Transcript_15636/g.23041  ORF Transcript_15636/g.23041 Transcript_15636/m.23041 type:complete len:93 (+) Transcript_15636:756-1034(+)
MSTTGKRVMLLDLCNLPGPKIPIATNHPNSSFGRDGGCHYLYRYCCVINIPVRYNGPGKAYASDEKKSKSHAEYASGRYSGTDPIPLIVPIF